MLGKTVPEALSTARGRRPRVVLKTEGTVFPNTDRPRPANNVFICFLPKSILQAVFVLNFHCSHLQTWCTRAFEI